MLARFQTATYSATDGPMGQDPTSGCALSRPSFPGNNPSASASRCSTWQCVDVHCLEIKAVVSVLRNFVKVA